MKALATFAIALAVSAGANAQPSSAANDPGDAHRAAAQDMLDACGERAQAEAYFGKLADSQLRGARQNLQGLSEAQWNEFAKDFRVNLVAKVDEYIQLTVAIDVAHFSEEDLNALAAFCRTPVGRRVAAARVDIERETFDIQQSWLEGAVINASRDALQKVSPDQAQGGGL